MSLGKISVSNAWKARTYSTNHGEDSEVYSSLAKKECTPPELPIIVDTREQKPYTFEGYDVEIVRRKLDTGDYSLVGLENRFAVERKAKDDFIASISWRHDPFKSEAKRAESFERPMPIVVEAPLEVFENGEYHRKVPVKTITSTVPSWEEAYNIEWCFEPSRQAGEYRTYKLLADFANKVA